MRMRGMVAAALVALVAPLVASLALGGVTPASAQDIAGTEDCTKTSGLDRRTGCLQANINFLQRTMTRNALEAHRRLQAAEGEIAGLKAALAGLRKQLDELQSARAAADKKAAGKSADEKKAEGKKK